MSVWIRTGKLTAPAITPENMIDVQLADRQLAETNSKAGRRLGRVVPDSPALQRAAALSTVFGAFEANFLQPAVATLALTETQRGQLERCWRDFRARASRGG